jgi:hypothetical protein
MPAPLTRTMDTDALARFIERRVNGELNHMRPRLFRHEPIAAMAILGTLALDAFRKFPEEHRMVQCDEWIACIRDAVRDTLG